MAVPMNPKIAFALLVLGLTSSIVPAADKTDTASTGRKEINVLIVGGGSSHDFEKWFHKADSETLSKLPGVKTSYTSKPGEVAAQLPKLDVLVQTSNQPFDGAELREGIFEFAKAGKGLVLVHPAIWYNWKDWPEYNKTLVGGGSRGHDKLGEFEVTVEVPTHPLMIGVPTKFRIVDELYYFQKADGGTPIEVLATGKSPINGKVYPVVWVTKHAQAPIACITLGHDGRAHELEAYQRLLQNSVTWAAGKQVHPKKD